VAPRLRRGIYLIPSLFTVGNIFCGFLSIVSTIREKYEFAALLILIAIIADILDGRIARLTGATSSFGEAYDSLADVISFGVAPAMLAFQWGLWQVPRIGISVAFLFLVAGSIRLARFSSRAHDAKNFEGLPIPAGAGAIAMLVLVSPTPVEDPWFIPVVVGFVLCLSLLMVSTLPYRSFKDINLRKRWPATSVFIIAMVFSLVVITPLVPYFLSVLAAIYILSAPVAVLTRKLRRAKPVPAITNPTGETTDVAHSNDPARH
jgi:CDP-diacylglycerol--serine O-phosphatidyltransferase